MDLKTLSLEYYNKKVIVTLKPGTEIYKKIGEKLSGTLVNRIWSEEADFVSNVAGITIQIEKSRINIFAQDILKLEKA